MNAKRKGTRNEHKTIRRLEAYGYTCMRAGASLGVFDIIAIGPRDVRLVQVKTNRNPGSVEVENMQLFVCPSQCVKEIWRWDDYAREPLVRSL